MTMFVLIATIFVAAYLFAAVTFYYGFKNWHPMCGGKPAAAKGKGIKLTFFSKQADRKKS